MRSLNIAISVFFTVATFALLLIINLSGANTTFLSQLAGSEVHQKLTDTTYYWTLYALCQKTDGQIQCTDRNAGYEYDPLQLAGFAYNKTWARGLRAAFGLWLAAVTLCFITLVYGILTVIAESRSSVGRKRGLDWTPNAYFIDSLFVYLICIAAAATQTGVHLAGLKKINHTDSDLHSKLGIAMTVLLWVTVGCAAVPFNIICWLKYYAKKNCRSRSSLYEEEKYLDDTD